MDIKNGDILTLENGDMVEVQLKVLPKKVEKLVPGRMYELKYSGQFCHLKTNDGNVDFIPGEYAYVGTVLNNTRDIFYKYNVGYAMFSNDSLTHVIKEI